jgi:hypothetical protein
MVPDQLRSKAQCQGQGHAVANLVARLGGQHCSKRYRLQGSNHFLQYRGERIRIGIGELARKCSLNVLFSVSFSESIANCLFQFISSEWLRQKRPFLFFKELSNRSTHHIARGEYDPAGELRVFLFQIFV